jgi:hypothetical protein
MGSEVKVPHNSEHDVAGTAVKNSTILVSFPRSLNDPLGEMVADDGLGGHVVSCDGKLPYRCSPKSAVAIWLLEFGVRQGTWIVSTELDPLPGTACG